MNESKMLLQSHTLFKLNKAGFFIFVFTCLSSWAHFAYADGWVPATTKQDGGALHKDPLATSEVLGRYPAGTQLKVYSPARSGFYAMYFAQEWKGVHYVWISENELDLSGKPDQAKPEAAREDSNKTETARAEQPTPVRRPASRSSSNSNSDYDTNVVRLGGTFSYTNPSDFETTIGAPSASSVGIGFGLEYEYRFSKTFAALLDVFYYSFSHTYTDLLTTSLAASGYGAKLGLACYILSGDGLTLAIAGTVGGALNSVSVTSTLSQTVASSLMTVPASVEVRLGLPVVGKLGVYLNLGYEFMTITSLPLVLSSSTPQTQTLSNLTLSAPVASTGLSFSF